MRNFLRAVSFILFAALMLPLFAGCGGKGDGEESGGMLTSSVDNAQIRGQIIDGENDGQQSDT